MDFSDIQVPEYGFEVIYADPPWKFSSKELCKYSGKRFTSLDKHYPTLSTKEICDLDVKSICADTSVLFIWTTDAHIPDALEVIKAWGFTYKTVAFVWEKITSKGHPVKTMGAWTLKSYELCLLATRGTPLSLKVSNSVQQKVSAKREEHSRKPNEVRKRIVALFGDRIPKIELFARMQVEGWTCWGNKVDKFTGSIEQEELSLF